jgi:autotransporter-associated beta strand protein
MVPYTDNYTDLTLTAGVQYSLLLTYNTGSSSPGYSFSITGPGCASTLTSCGVPIQPGTTSTTSNLGDTVLPTFQGGTLLVDVPGQTYSQNFTLDGSGTNTIDQNGNAVTLSGVFCDAIPGTPGGIIIANSGSGGSVTLTGVNTYTGATTINSGATLALAGAGSVASSSGVADNGTLDISGTTVFR